MPLHAFGSNGSGQLGIGHTDDVSIPAKCLFETQESGENDIDITRIVAGGNHTLLLSRDGNVYAAGCNEDGRCGVVTSSSSSSSSTDAAVKFRRATVKDAMSGNVIETFKGVSATWEGSFLVASIGEEEGDAVFVLGSGGKGELGLGEGVVQAVGGGGRIEDFPPQGTRIVSIASGMGHTVVVLSNGEVYGWGGARKGQLGDVAKGQKISWTPVKMDGVPFFATDAVCGREFTVVMGDKNAGEFAVIGSADDKWNILSDTPAASPSGYAGIAASWHGAYIHQNDSSVVAWGRNDRGQLPPADLVKARKVAVGSEHALALLDDKAVVAFGWGEHGNCGPDTDAQGNVKGKFSHVPLGDEGEVVGIGAGCATSWIITR